MESKITQEQFDQLLKLGLTKRIINNYIKKEYTYEKVLTLLNKKLEDIENSKELRNRLGKDMKIPKVKMVKKDKEDIIDLNQIFNVTFPMLPSVNHMYMTTKYGGRQLTNKCKILFLDLQQMIIDELKIQKWQPTYNKFLIAEMKFYMDSNRIKDSHNMFKFLFDVMEDILYDNDYYLLPQVLDISVDKENPRIELTLKIKK